MTLSTQVALLTSFTCHRWIESQEFASTTLQMQKRMSELMGAPWFRELIEKLERFRGRHMDALKGEASVA